MKKMAKWLAGIAAIAAVMSLCSCILTVEALAGNKVTVVNDTGHRVKVDYCTGAAWEGDSKSIELEKDAVTKITVSEFWPLWAYDYETNETGIMEVVHPYVNKIKLSDLTWSKGSSYNSSSSYGNSYNNNSGTLNNTTEYTVIYTDSNGDVQTTFGYGSYLKSFNLEQGTDYTISGTTITLTESGKTKLSLS